MRTAVYPSLALLLTTLTLTACGTQEGRNDHRAGNATASQNDGTVKGDETVDPAPTDDDEDKPSQTPTQTPTQTPGKGPGQSPAQSPNQGPAQTPGQMPAPTPGQTAKPITIKRVTAQGAACPSGTVAGNVSPDGQAFTLLFSDFQLSLEGGGKRNYVEASCAVDMTVAVPAGYRFTILTLDYRGNIVIDGGDVATLATRFPTFTTRTTFNGPLNKDYNIRQKVAVQSVGWFGCGSTDAHVKLAIDATLRNKSGKGNLLTVDSADGELKQTFAIQWAKCN